MKKFIALVLALFLSFLMSFSAFALKSPVAEKVYKIYFVDKDGKTTSYTVEDGATITFEADSNKGDFTRWIIYQLDGKKTLAIDGKHYKLAYNHTLESVEVTITPMDDLIVSPVYNNKVPDFSFNQNGEPVSPKTSDNGIAILSVLMVIAMAGVVVSVKKQRT